MLKSLKRLARSTCGSFGGGPGGAAHRCADAGPLWDRSGLEDVVERAQRTSDEMVMQMPPRFDADHAPLRFEERRDGVPCELADCPYAFVLAVPLHSRESAEREARRQLQPPAMRYFVRLRLAGACVMSCEGLTQIDEQTLRDGVPTANATLRLLRDAGADVLLVRGEMSSRVAVVFKHAIGRRVRVLHEAAATVRQDGVWVGDALEPARSHDGWHGLVRRLRWLRERPRVGRMAWELTIALVCFLLAPPLARLAGATLAIPVWAELLLGAAAAATAAVATWRALVPARAEIARMPEQLVRFERVVQARNRELHRDVMDAFGVLMDRIEAGVGGAGSGDDGDGRRSSGHDGPG